jgi:hypothetical protein
MLQKAFFRHLVPLAIFTFFNLLVITADAAQGPFAAWSFDSTAGGRYIDVSGHGYDAIPSGTGLGLITGIKGQALSCPNSGYDIDISNSKDSFALNAITVESWYYANALSTLDQAKILEFSYIASGIRNGYSLFIYPTGFPVFSIASGNQWMGCQSNESIASGRWYHIVGSYDNNFLRLYVNGELKNSLPCTGGIMYPVGQDVRIGCQKLQDGTLRYFANGRIDELRVYNYALTADSILAHYQNEAPGIIILLPVVPNPTYNQKPVFRWYSKKPISTYRLQIASDQSFLSSIISLPLSDTFYLPSANLPFGTIFWHVADNADTSTWSAISSFTIQDTAVPILIPYAPDPTRLRKPKLSWHHVTGATSYTIQINSTPSFTSPFISDGATDTFYTPAANLPVGSIFWHVKSNLKDQYSILDTFVILNDSIPFLIPVFPDTQYIRKPVLRWHPGTGATSYRLQIDTIGDFVNPFISIPLSDTVDTPSVNLPYGKICWRVSANSNPSRYSMTDTFWVMVQGSVLPYNSGKMSHGISLSYVPHKGGIRIEYSLNRPGNLTLQIFSTSGQCVATLWDAACSAGAHTLLWQARDNRGVPVQNGSYILVCRLNENLLTQKIFLTK